MSTKTLEFSELLEMSAHVRAHSGEPFKRPPFANDPREYSSGFFWENLDGDRFYFESRAAALADLAHDCGLSKEDTARLLRLDSARNGGA